MLGSSLFSVSPVLANDYDERIRTAEQEALENEQAADSLDALMSQISGDISDTQSAVDSLNQEIKQNESALDTALENLEATKQEMETLLDEIADLEQKIEDRSDKLDTQARTVQVSGNPENYFEFILNSESLTDIFARIDIVAGLINSSNNMMEEQMKDKQAVQDKTEETEKTITQQNALAGELETKSAELEAQRASQKALVAQLELEQNTIESEQDALLAQRNEALGRAETIANNREAAELAAAEAEEDSEEEQSTEENSSVTTTASSQTENNEINNSGSNSDNGSNNQSESTPAPEPQPDSEPAPDPEPQPDPEPTPDPEPAPEPEPQPDPEPTPDPEPAPAPSGNVLGIASQYLGVPYLWTGTTPGGFDCSGFTQYVFAQAGKSIPRTTGSQYASAQKVSNPQPGDLVFFSTGRNGNINHVGIVTGNGQFIGSQSSTGVAYASYTSGYWGASGRVVGFGRY